MNSIRYFFFLLLSVGALAAGAQQKQSLKDLLYGGKLKKDSTGVIRSTDDLSSKIDTTTKRQAEPEPVVIAVIPADSMKKSGTTPTTVVASNKAKKDAAGTVNTTAADPVNTVPTTSTISGDLSASIPGTGVAATAPIAAGTEAAATPPPAAAAKTNTKLWKEYVDTLDKSLKEEVLKSKQIKKETYYISVDYEIGLDGTATILGVNSTPENKMLQAQIKQMMETNPPHLNPYLDSTNQPKKVKRKQNFTIVKD